MKRVVFLAIAAALASSPAPGASRAAPPGRAIVILDRPVRVEARLRPDDSSGLFVFDLVVRHAAEHCTLQTALVLRRGSATLAGATQRLRQTIDWRGGYLFVRTECGGGNAWKCTSESVFALRNGRLVGLGTLAARSRATGIGTSLRVGMFWDANADLEINELTSHAGATWFELRLREHDGRLVADSDSTWAANAREYAERDGLAKANARPPAEGGTWENAISPRLGNAAVAKYCGRSEHLAAILDEARGLLPADLMARFEVELAKLEPGVLPRSSAPPLVRRNGGTSYR